MAKEAKILSAILVFLLLLTFLDIQRDEVKRKEFSLLRRGNQTDWSPELEEQTHLKSQLKQQAIWSQELQELFANSSLPDSLRGVMPKYLPSPYNRTLCVVCKSAVKEIVSQYNGPKSRDKVKKMLTQLCELLNIQKYAVCASISNTYIDIVLYLVVHIDPGWLTEGMCGLLINSGDCIFEEHDWTLDVDLGTKPDVITPIIPEEPTETMTVVHLTDLHLDSEYKAGSKADCGEPLCCRDNTGKISYTSTEAGYWGDYRNCDAPKHTIVNTIKHITDNVQGINYIYVTGDYVDHSVWKTSVDKNAKKIMETIELIKNMTKRIPIIFTLGNHEAHPSNQYSPLDVGDDFNQKWLYELVSDLWSPYITEEAKKTILQGGFYTLKLQQRFRVIVINNMAVCGINFWKIYNMTDPFGQLKWLSETLLKAEAEGEKVHILYHNDIQRCLKTWSREYHRIIDRFENIIAAQFNGHTHKDEFQVFYSVDNATRANGVLYNGGSVTPNFKVNPNYKVYRIDAQTLYVYEVESWIFNLTRENLNPSEMPYWYKQYTFREDYGVRSLTPSHLDQLTHKMAVDHELLYKHFRYYYKNGDLMLAEGCDDKCLKDKLCSIVTTTQCKVLLEEFDATKRKGFVKYLQIEESDILLDK